MATPGGRVRRAGIYTRHFMRSRFAPALFVIAAIATIAAFAGPAPAAERSVKDFFGAYVGRSISNIGEGLSQRDLNVVIKKHKKGFTLDWTTVTRKADGAVKSKSYSINFRATQRRGIFASAMRNNVFGGAEPLDPLKGDPYVWAGIKGDTLTVHALLITDDGGYEMQVYERTLTKDGLLLNFSRIRDGTPLRHITGTLKKTGG